MGVLHGQVLTLLQNSHKLSDKLSLKGSYRMCWCPCAHTQQHQSRCSGSSNFSGTDSAENIVRIFCIGWRSKAFLFSLNINWSGKDTKLSGILAKSGPLYFATKNSFPSFFVFEKGLVHMYQNHFMYFPILYFCFATSQKPTLPTTGFPPVNERLNFMDFEARYGRINADYKVFTLTQYLR